MTEKKETIFADGVRVSKPSEKAPDFIKALVGINIGDFVVWAGKHSKNGWVNLNIKESKNGKFYADLDQYERKPRVNEGEAEYPDEDVPKEPDTMTSEGYGGEPAINTEDIPF
jgi:hypothetical protein